MAFVLASCNALVRERTIRLGLLGAVGIIVTYDTLMYPRRAKQAESAIGIIGAIDADACEGIAETSDGVAIFMAFAADASVRFLIANLTGAIGIRHAAVAAAIIRAYRIRFV